MEPKSELIIYQSEDGLTKIETRLLDETVWLTQSQMSELFQKERSVISKHIKNIFAENELEEKSNVQILHITNSDRPVSFYNLDVIISVGYRVKSQQGIKFRQWATARLKEYLIKGFTMNDDLLKQAGGGNYFDELLARIRDIRSSEKVFWRKVLDIYATSIDYDPKTEFSVTFFKTVQNKMHWAAHGHTAAEIIYQRVDAAKQNLGLTNFKGQQPSRQEIEIAKNYLNQQELELLNRMVTAYLEVAELQALNRKPMYMADWVSRLNDFLTMMGNDILNHAGKISHEQAIEKAQHEYELYRKLLDNELSQVEKDFIQHFENKAIDLNKKKKTN